MNMRLLAMVVVKHSFQKGFQCSLAITNQIGLSQRPRPHRLLSQSSEQRVIGI